MSTNTTLKVEQRPLSSIKPYEKNPRRNDGAVDAVAASIKQFGFKVPIVIDKDGVIVAGHTRYKAAQRLGLKNVPCVVASDLSPAQVKAFRLADNKVSELATWDFDLLSEEMGELAGDFDLGEFGFPDYFNDDGTMPAQGEGAQPGAPADGAQTQPAVDTSALPPELQGATLTPPPMQEFTGDDQTAMERVIIVYPKAREAEIATLLRLKEITKVVYTINEIPPAPASAPAKEEAQAS